MAGAESYERVILAKPEVFVYQIPPRGSNRAVRPGINFYGLLVGAGLGVSSVFARAADWQLTNPNWRGRMRIVIKGDSCCIKLEDRISGELFAMCPVDNHPGVAIEPVSDSSRYFVIRLQDSSGQHAFVGIGFEDRGDAFDFNVSLQDHFKGVKTSNEIAKEETQPLQHKDYSLKEGQKIQINLGKTNAGLDSEGGSNRPKGSSGIDIGPGGALLPPPPTNASRPLNPPLAEPQQPKDDWGDFASFGSDSKSDASGGGWVQF